MKSYLLSVVMIALYCCSAQCGEVLKEIWSIKVDAITGNKGMYPEKVYPFTGEDGSVAVEFYNPSNSLDDYIVWISSSGEVLKTISKLEIFGTGYGDFNPAEVDILGCSNQLLTIIESRDDIAKNIKIIQYTKAAGGLVTSQVETIPSSKTRGIWGTDGGNKNIVITLKSQFKKSQSDTIVCYQLIKQHNGAGAGIGGGLLSQYVSFKSDIYDQFGILGGSVEFKVDVASSIPVTYQWQKDGKDLAGAALTNLRIDKIATINSGVYTLIVKSALGSVTSSPAKLDVVSLPIVTFSTNRVSGEYGKLTAIAPTIISQGPTFYRWYKDGVLLTGEETSSIDIYATSKSGNYFVECRNLAGITISKPVVFVGFAIPLGTKKWEFETEGPVGSSPAIGSDGTVYVGSFDKKVYALNGATGAKKWEFLTGGGVPSSPAIGSEGTVYVGSYDKKVYALNGATGAKKWEFLTGGEVWSSPAIGSDGTVYVGSDDKKVYALNGATGAKKWEFETGGPVGSSPAIASDGTVYVGSSDRKVYALNGATGAKKWEFETGGPVGSSPAIASDGTVYVGSKKVYALNGATGAKKWEFQLGGEVSSSPAIGSDGTVYVGSNDDKVYALNGATGAKKWEFLTGGMVRSSPAIGSDGTVYVGSDDKKVYALNGATGAKKWEFLTGDSVSSSPAIGSDGTVYVGSYDWKVYAIASDSMGLMASSWPKYRSLNNSQGQIAPYISIQPKTEGVAVAIGKRAVLEATVISQMSVTLQWSKNGNIFPRATNSVFEIPSVTLLDEGYYQLTATLADGRSVSTVFSIAISKPEIVKQPQGGQFQEGPNFFISIDVNGYLIKYQWKLDGVDLPDATNSFLQFSALRLTDKGKYTVTVSNPIGSVLSEPAAIIVSRLPVGNMYWEYLTGNGVFSSPAIGSDGTVYVGSNDDKVYALNGATGAKKWEFLTGGWVHSSPAIGSDGTVYVGSWDNKVYALNGATGAKKWEFLTGGEVYSSPAIGSDGTVYVGSKKVYALNGATGAKKWEYLTGNGVFSSPAIGSDGTVYVGSHDNKVYALNGATGAKKWEFLTGGGVASSPAIGSDGTVYVGSYDKKVYALNGATGAKKWEFETGSGVNSSPAIGSDGTVYVGSFDKKVYALNGATGAKKWEFLTGEGVYSSPAIGSDGTVYVGSYDKKVYALNGATGAKKWEFLTGMVVFSSPAIGSDGTVYVGSGDKKVYAIASSSEGLVKSPWSKFHANNSNTGKIASGFGPLIIIYSPQSGLNLNIPTSPDFDTILEYSTNLNQWSEQQRFGRQSNTPSIVVPLKMDQTKAMEYWRARNQ
jgi:outer membrane protein assembly factor BamB